MSHGIYIAVIYIYIYIILHRNPERKLYIYMGSYYENSLFTTIQNVIKYKKRYLQ